jgi:tetratricopeptide (TPR) repeat protein
LKSRSILFEPAGATGKRGMRMAGAALVFVLALAVYLLTLAPTVTFVDSGELIVAARSLGVAHPPGFPLYLLLAHLASLIPFGNIAQRINFASALFAALAVSFLFLIVSEALLNLKAGEKSLTKPLKQSGKSKKRRETIDKKSAAETTVEGNGLRLALVPALVAALLFGFSRTLWSFATVAEVYTLNSLLILIIWYLMFRWRVTGNNKLLLLAAFIFGLALGVHHVTVGVMLPALAVFVYQTAGSSFFKSRQLLYAALIAMAGTIVVYAYLPLAAQRLPIMNWGDPRTLQRIWWHISGHQYQVFFSFSPAQIANQSVEFFRLATREFNPVWLPLGLLLSITGIVALWRRDRTSFWFIVLVIVADLAYSLNYEIAEDKGAYYLPAFIAASAAAGFGAHFLLRSATRKWPQNHAALISFALILLSIPVVTLAANFPYSNRHNFFMAGDYVANIERPIAPQGMLLTSDWQVYSPLLYLREIEKQRTDIVAIDVNLLRRSWYFDYLKSQYPDLMADTRATTDTFLADLRHWEQDPDAYGRSQVLNRQIDDHFHEMLQAFVTTHLRRAPVYVTWEVGLGLEDKEFAQSLGARYRLVPEGLVFRLTSDLEFNSTANLELVTRGINDGSFRFASDDVVTIKVVPVYVNMLVNRGKYLEAVGHAGEALEFYQRALQLDPNSVAAQESLANYRQRMRRVN